MIEQHYIKAIKESVAKGDDVYLLLVASCLVMGDQAKNALRKKGYGWTGLDLLKTVEMVPECEDGHTEDVAKGIDLFLQMCERFCIEHVPAHGGGRATSVPFYYLKQGAEVLKKNLTAEPFDPSAE